MFSKACEYAIRSVIFIATASLRGERVGFKEIAAAIDSPEAFTAKTLQKLSKSGLVDSVKGVGGGFEIPLDRLDVIRLCEIVNIIDGDAIYKGCGLGLPECSELHPCPVHEQFKAIREDLRTMLENTTVGDLATGIKKGNTFLKLD